MNRLQRELVRLYGSDGPTARQRALVLEVARPADWPTVGAIWQGVQNDLGLPAPAIAVNGKDGYQLWFSLASGLSDHEGQAFLDGLAKRYPPSSAAPTVSCWRGDTGDWAVPPAAQSTDERWSAFVAPDLAPIFAADPWLDFLPSTDAQADILLGLKSMSPSECLAAIAQLAPQGTDSALAQSAGQPGTASAQAFLRHVMNDPDTPLALRIEAAKALLPYER